MKNIKIYLTSGFTLMELLIVIAVIAIIAVGTMTNWKKQIQKGYDSKRKSNLYHIKLAFNEYFNDYDRYPDLTIVDDCGGDQLVNQGLKKMPCDPESKQPYIYEYITANNPRSGFRLYTTLMVLTDPDIESLGCQIGCNVPTCPTCNYGIAEGGTVKQ